MRIACLALTASLSVFTKTLDAQRCMGGASFADRRAHVAANASAGTAGHSASGHLGIGLANGPFASVGLGSTHSDDVNDDATLFAATAGLGFPFGPESKALLCPFISVVVINPMASNGTVTFQGRSFDITSTSSQSYGLGASVGTVLKSVTAFELVPFFSAAVIARNTTIRIDEPVEAVGDHYYSISFGAGAIIQKVITIRPFITSTVAEKPSSTSFGVHVSFSFGLVMPRRPVAAGEGSLTLVWLNTRAGVYYCPGSTSYGATPEGTFMTEREALAGGATPAYGKRC